jgi:hypothetical protein
MVSQYNQTPPQCVVPSRPHFFLTSNRVILRGESLIQCELSDMFDFVKPDEGPDGQDDNIMIIQIHQGKTSQHKTILGLSNEEQRCQNVSHGKYCILFVPPIRGHPGGIRLFGKLELIQSQAYCFVCYNLVLG